VRDDEMPLQTAPRITAWLHQVFPQAVERVIAGRGNHSLLASVVQCLLQNTHDSRLTDWTPEQIADWCHRVRLHDVQAILRDRVAA
jgi:hypothetical protein